MWFDPIEKRNVLEGQSGYRRLLAKKVEDLAGATPCTRAIDCILCNLPGPAAELINLHEKILDWKERTGLADAMDVMDKGLHYGDKMLVQWLKHNEDVPEYFVHVLAGIKATDPDDMDWESMDIMMLDCVHGGEYAYAVELFEKYSTKEIPKNSNQVSSPQVMAYLLARHYLEDPTDHHGPTDSLARFLTRVLSRTYFSQGDFDGGVRWLKIAHWNGRENPPTPEELILKAYDYMPKEAERYRLLVEQDKA